MENAMNELWLDMGRGFLYYQTGCETIDTALEELSGKLHNIGVNDDNFSFEKAELRKDFYNPDIPDYTVIEERDNRRRQG